MLKRVAMLALGFCVFGGSANAAVLIGGITGGTALVNGGAFKVIAAPAAVGFDNFNDNNLRAFNEAQNIILSSRLSVDTLAAGRSGAIAALSKISSHLIVFDPAGKQTDVLQPTLAGFVTFDAPILGVIWRDRSLIATNERLGAVGTTYLSPAGVGLEQGSDFFSVGTGANANRLTITFFKATSPGDELRVITGRSGATIGTVPEPATWLSMIFGFGLLGAMLRRASGPRKAFVSI